MATGRAAAAAAATSDFVPFSDLQTMPEDVRVGDIEFDMHYQRRGKINTKLYDEYAELWKDKIDLASREPMIIARLIDDHNRLIVLDAWHRAKGLIQAFGADHVHRFEVASVTTEQAYVASYGANPAHGYARTNEDKRAITDDALINFTNRSDGTIAKWCAVSVRYVGIRRAELEKDGKLQKVGVRLGLNNKTMTTEDIGGKKKTDPAPASAPSIPVGGAPAPAKPKGDKFVDNGKGNDIEPSPRPLIDPATQPNHVPSTLPGGGFDQIPLPGGVTMMLLDNKTFSVCQGDKQIDLPALQVWIYLKAYSNRIS
jgi:hypothetical protein